MSYNLKMYHENNPNIGYLNISELKWIEMCLKNYYYYLDDQGVQAS